MFAADSVRKGPWRTAGSHDPVVRPHLGDFWILDRRPVLHRRIVALVCPPRRLLWCIAPSRQVLTDSPNRKTDAELTPQQLTNRTMSPSGNRQRQLIGAFAAYQLLGTALLLRRQRSNAPVRPPATRHTFKHLRRVREAFEHRRGVRACVSGDPRDLDVRLALLVQHEHLTTQFQSNVCACASSIGFHWHAPSSRHADTVSNSYAPGK